MMSIEHEPEQPKPMTWQVRRALSLAHWANVFYDQIEISVDDEGDAVCNDAALRFARHVRDAGFMLGRGGRVEFSLAITNPSAE